VTPAQLKALESYISAVAHFMLKQLSAREVVDSRKRLEAAFGYELPTVLPSPEPLKDLL
jgi:hypothetical protein